jgi:hypothetical protein
MTSPNVFEGIGNKVIESESVFDLIDLFGCVVQLTRGNGNYKFTSLSVAALSIRHRLVNQPVYSVERGDPTVRPRQHMMLFEPECNQYTRKEVDLEVFIYKPV